MNECKKPNLIDKILYSDLLLNIFMLHEVIKQTTTSKIMQFCLN